MMNLRRSGRMKESGVREVIEAVNAAKDEIIGEFHKVRPAKPLPTSNRRGPKNTKMMKIERKILETYLEIDCHRDISSCTPADAHHVWNLPEKQARLQRRRQSHGRQPRISRSRLALQRGPLLARQEDSGHPH